MTQSNNKSPHSDRQLNNYENCYDIVIQLGGKKTFHPSSLNSADVCAVVLKANFKTRHVLKGQISPQQ